ncbi:hypothetical protein J4443_03485 [Candidatus Woesearchaeota archaeon]|nr:hypothetical protein [Candidatus Woesearchaeota archaeon]
MTIMQNIGFIIGYIFLLAIAIGFAAKFISIEDKFLVKLDNAEDSVVANRVVRCFSKEGDFGVMDASKINGENGAEILRRCMGDKYAFNVKLARSEGNDVRIETDNLEQKRVVSRYVVVDDKEARLEVGYSKK